MKKKKKNNWYFIFILSPCFITVPFVLETVISRWSVGLPLRWTTEFTSLTVLSILGSIAGIGLFIRLKWGRILALLLFLTGMSIWLVIFFIELANDKFKGSTLSLLLLIYGICLVILIFANGEQKNLSNAVFDENILDDKNL